MDEKKSERHLEKIFSIQHEEKFRYELKWEPNMITIWDNFSVLHRASRSDPNETRRMYRIMITE